MTTVHSYLKRRLGELNRVGSRWVSLWRVGSYTLLIGKDY